MNKEQQQIIDEAYENHSKEYEKDNSIGISHAFALIDGTRFYRKIDKETFIALCTCDEAFSEQWGLKIEERELSLEERGEWDSKNDNVRNGWIQTIQTFTPKEVRAWLNEKNVPTKLITVTYNNKTIESYE
jgi:hypothetical protein